MISSFNYDPLEFLNDNEAYEPRQIYDPFEPRDSDYDPLELLDSFRDHNRWRRSRESARRQRA